VDVGISYESGYMLDLIESVEEGQVPMALIDRAVRRILRQKFRLGLFENPYVDPERAEKVVHNAGHQELALRAARESLVLLKNDNNVLPLDKNIKSLAVIGPNADNDRNLLGDYVSHTILQDIPTILEGIKEVVSPSTKVTYVRGCDVVGADVNEIEKAKTIAAGADAAIVVIGENERRAEGGKGTNGEGRDAATLELTGLQQELVKSVVATGTPTVVVLVNGRPLATRWIAENVPAMLEAWVCGEKGGLVVAEVLFGDQNPCGKLPVTVPRHAGQLPVYYNYKKSKSHWLEHGWGKSYVDIKNTPLYPFGHGLSYTTFAYSNLSITPAETAAGGTVTVSVDIKNTGKRFGKEIVQLYIQDVISSVSKPVKELKGFQKIGLQSGETKTVTFTLTPEHLELYNSHLERVVEPGEFKVQIGSSSLDIRLKGDFMVN